MQYSRVFPKDLFQYVNDKNTFTTLLFHPYNKRLTSVTILLRSVVVLAIHSIFEFKYFGWYIDIQIGKSLTYHINI